MYLRVFDTFDFSFYRYIITDFDKADLRLLKIPHAVLWPVDVAHNTSWQLSGAGKIVLGESQEQRKGPDHPHHQLGLSGRQALLEWVDDSHVPAGGV